MIYLPADLLTSETEHPTIRTGGLTIMESCLYQEELRDLAFVEDLEVIYVRTGTLEVIIDEQKHRVGPGQLVVFPKGTSFRFHKHLDAVTQRYESILFFFHPAEIEAFLAATAEITAPGKASATLPVLNVDDLLQGYLASITPYFHSTFSPPPHLLAGKVHELLYHLVRLNASVRQLLWRNKQPAQADLAEVMNRHFTENLRLQDFARMCNRSLSTFQRDFRKTYQQTPQSWLKEKRLELAARMLRSSRVTPTEAAYRVGFVNYAHFSRSFKQHFGVSPSKFGFDQVRHVS